MPILFAKLPNAVGLAVFVLFMLISAFSSWLKQKEAGTGDWTKQKRPRSDAPPPSPLPGSLGEEWRTVVQEARRRTEPPPVVVPTENIPVPPVVEMSPIPDPVFQEAPEAMATADRQYAEGEQVDVDVDRKFEEVAAVMESPQPLQMRTANRKSPIDLHSPDKLRNAILASIILGPPKALE